MEKKEKKFQRKHGGFLYEFRYNFYEYFSTSE